MSTVDNAMLKECLLESILAEIKEIEAMEYPNIKASESFKERIKNTINSGKAAQKKHFPKKVAIAFIAAVILSLSIMFTVSAEIRQAVADFFVKAYETFTQFIIVENDGADTNTSGSDITQAPITYPTTIETEYMPSYINKNNYVQLDKVTNKYNIWAAWSNDTYIIDLAQQVIDSNDIILDTENASYQTAYIGEQKVYYVLKNNTYTIKWLEYGYSFNMSCDEALGWDEVEKIVLSLEPVTD
ncbi:MAG: hypothetical protein E7596_02170 [Ruminococcaceae bacterium]|nr:hypothetical protein [Oscillospiraceae bacterium]